MFSKRILLLLSFAVLSGALLLPPPVRAWYPRLDSEALVRPAPSGAIVGTNRPYVIGSDETLMEIARRGRLGFSALVNANPGQDAWLPEVGAELLLPYSAIVPGAYRPGITINLAEYRLYLVEEEGGLFRVRIYPIGLGREGWLSPEGTYTIAEMIKDPIWTRPETMRGDPTVPNIIAAGPENPLGSFWLGLSLPGYGIHGTNRPYGIGRRVSHGCIRLYPSDITDLAARVTRGTPVTIVYQPAKVAIVEEQLYVEVHPDYLGRIGDLYAEVSAQAARLGWQAPLDRRFLRGIIAESRGIPVAIDRTEAALNPIDKGPAS